jgi:hypothetical protein
LPESLSLSEMQIVSLLMDSGIDRIEALVAVVLVIRSYSRPRQDLVETLRSYAGLEDRAKVLSAISALEASGWLTTETTYGVTILGPAPDLRRKIQDRCKQRGLAKKLLDLRRVNDEYATVIGPLRDIAAFSSYIELLKGAQNHINMPMIATSASGLESTPILIDRAAHGVKVRILGATPSLAAVVRGEAIRSAVKERIEEWKVIAAKNRNVEFRVTNIEEDLQLASSISIDTRILRLVVYDFVAERSKEGVVVEFSANDGRPLNIIEEFEAKFATAWKRSAHPSWLGQAGMLVRQFWQFGVGALITILTYVGSLLFGKSGWIPLGDDVVPLWVAVATSVAASFFFAGSVEFGQRLRARPKSRR